MDYQRIYSLFIDSRISVSVEGYSESHHIKPKSLGGSDAKSNIIKLTPREHFFAHLLLAKIHGGKMWAALSYMSRGGTKSAINHKCTSRQYDYISRKDAEWKSQRYSGEGNPFYKKSHSAASLKKMRKPRRSPSPMRGMERPGVGDVIAFVRTYDPRGTKYDFTIRDRIDAFHAPKPETMKVSEYYRRVISGKRKMEGKDISGDKNPNYGNGQAISGDKNPMYGMHHSEATKRKIGEKSKRTITCPHCGKISNIANAHRWHLDNCKSK